MVKEHQDTGEDRRRLLKLAALNLFVWSLVIVLIIVGLFL